MFLLSACVKTKVYTINLGETSVQIIKLTKPGVKKTIVHLHENETTAFQAAKEYMRQNGGTVISLHHQKQRDIHFVQYGQSYAFDPNRIFTNHGIEMTLKQHGRYSKEAHQAVRGFALKIVDLLPQGKVIAVHNNQGYSLKDYFPKHPLAHDVCALRYLPKSSFRNFYFVTDKQNYQRLKKFPYNIALQSRQAQDDGSLSYFLSKKPYINIEAAYDALKVQIKMLEDA